jgi:tetratricopeptide (TPR) repeat protein
MSISGTAVKKLIAAIVVTLAAVLCAHAEEPPALTSREIVERVGDAVVLIEAERRDGSGQGSGFIVGDDGAIVTNLHVLEGATELAITLSNGTRISDLAVRAFDVERDLAVLVAGLPSGMERFPTVDLGDPSSAGPGTKILVIANPLGLEQTVTEGIVSAWREPDEGEPTAPSGVGTPGLMLPPCRLLQISATISPGSSGGPVLDDRAEVIGVATAGVLHGLAGLNFAVPIDELSALLEVDDEMDLASALEHVDFARLELAGPHFEDGRAAHDREEVGEASYHVERALQVFPRYEDALLLSGRIALEAGEIELAERRFVAAIEVNEESAEGWYGLGRIHHLASVSTGDAALLARAEAEYEKTLDLDFRHAGAALQLAVIQTGRGDLDRAAELLRLAIESEPRLPDAHYMLGEIHLARDQFGEAREEFEQALWEDEDHALSHFGLAKLYTITDRTPHGTVSPNGPGPEHWERFLELSEGDPDLALKREIAIRIVRQYLPHLLD